MRWLTFAIFALVFLVLEQGLATLLRVGGAAPSFILILLVFVGLHAPSLTVAKAALVLGLLVDLTTPLRLAGATREIHTAVIGPMAVGYLLGAYALIQVRGLVFRESVPALAACTFVVGIFIALAAIFLLGMRGFIVEPVVQWSAAERLVQAFVNLLYTTVLALPVGILLLRLQPLFGFEHAKGLGYGPRR